MYGHAAAGRGIKGEGIGDSLNATPAFATAVPSAILASMPTQEINTTQWGIIAQDGNVAESTRRLAVMNLALRGIETLRLANSRCVNRGMNRVKARRVHGKMWPCASTFGPEHADNFRRDLHPDLRAA